MKVILFTLLLVIPAYLDTGNAFAQQIKPQPTTRELSAKGSLRCSPQQLWADGTLTLTMSTPHGRDLAIRSPSGQFFWLRYWEPDNQEIVNQWQAFKKVKQLKIMTSTAKGNLGRSGDKLIFAKTGWYRVRISYNLETDDGTPFNECKVYYVHKRKPNNS